MEKYISQLEQTLKHTNAFMSGNKIDYKEFLRLAMDSLLSAAESGKFYGVEPFLSTLGILCIEYDSGMALDKNWNNEFDEFIEDLNGFLAEKLA